jgi:hypothetical protein
MAPSVPSPEDFITSFPHQIPKIQGPPTYDALSLAKDALKANAASIPSTRGGGDNGYFGLVLSPAAYATVNATAFNIPDFPGAQPANLAGSAAVIQEAVCQHAEDLREWRKYVNVNQVLKKQLINAVERIYLRALKNRNVGYNNRSLYTMLQFHFDNYGNITPMDLKANSDLINTAWDPNTLFEMLIDQIETCSDIAKAGSQPFAAAQILNPAYTLVYNTGFFFDDCKAWNRKPAADNLGMHSRTTYSKRTYSIVCKLTPRSKQVSTVRMARVLLSPSKKARKHSPFWPLPPITTARLLPR